jgi:hypothetical protein
MIYFKKQAVLDSVDKPDERLDGECGGLADCGAWNPNDFYLHHGKPGRAAVPGGSHGGLGSAANRRCSKEEREQGRFQGRLTISRITIIDDRESSQ